MKFLTTLRMYGLLAFCYLLSFQEQALATTSTLGDVAKNLYGPIKDIGSLVRAICLVAGIGLLVGAFIKYLQHRRNPVEVTLSSCFSLLLAGIALIVLIFVPKPDLRN